jgi:hypothetical protein
VTVGSHASVLLAGAFFPASPSRVSGYFFATVSIGALHGVDVEVLTAAAPAARCRNCLRGSFMALPSESHRKPHACQAGWRRLLLDGTRKKATLFQSVSPPTALALPVKIGISAYPAGLLIN